MVKNMKNKIVLGSFFATIILLLQILTVPPVVADGETNLKIEFNDEDKANFENVISNLEGTVLFEEINTIYDSNLDDNDEFEVSGFIQMLEQINEYYQNTKPQDTSYFASSINELVLLILGVVFMYIVLIPAAVLFDILDDAMDLIYYYTDCLSEPEFLLAITLNKYLPDLYNLLIELELIKNYYIDIPDTDEEKKQYVREKFNEVMQLYLPAMVITISSYIYSFYLGPKLGYLSRMGQDIIGCCIAAKEIVGDYQVKLEHFRDIFVNLPVAFMDFIRLADHEIITDFIALVHAIDDASTAAGEWMEEFAMYGPEVLIDLGIIVVTLTDLFIYYTVEVDEPWLRPATVTVEVSKDKDETIEISFKDNDQTDTKTIDTNRESGQIELKYQTDITNNPKGLHTFTIIATSSSGETIEKTGSAFSDGSIKIDINHKKLVKPKITIKDILSNIKGKLLDLVENLQKIFFNLSPSFILN